jgi:hypothetical protein
MVISPNPLRDPLLEKSTVLGVCVSTKIALHIVIRLPSLRAAWPKNQSSETENLRKSQQICVVGEFGGRHLIIPRMSAESVYQKSSIPQRDSSMRKSGTSNLASERSLQPTKFVLQILSLLA